MEQEKQSIFRQMSQQRLTSPEQLGAYVRVANPGVWVILTALILLLAGGLVWGCFGQLDTTIRTSAACQNRQIVLMIPEAEGEHVAPGMTVIVDGFELKIKEVSNRPYELSESADHYLMHLGGLEAGDWVYTATAEGMLEDGVYQADIRVNRETPLSFLFN
ncbi:MAG: hypothetical protein IKN55_03025 [Oscillospiraceae bacterium]|nr:hypothetical protein [Oscillospiraceae bacterium]